MTRRRAARLPYDDPFSKSERLAIVDALHLATSRIVAAKEIDYATADEPEITSKLVIELNAMLDEEPPAIEAFTSLNVETITNSGRLCSFNEAHIEKQPDLVFRPRGKRPPGVQRDYCGLFVECKIVDVGHPMGAYCGDGLQRFIEGQYAWAMRYGMMLGYARGAYRLPKQLTTHLADYPRYGTVSMPVSRPSAGPGVYVSIHARTWTHPTGESPEDIELRHLWIPI
jgi:hypothetical protein